MTLSAICPRLPKAPTTPSVTPPELRSPGLPAQRIVTADELSMDGLLLRRKDNQESLRRLKSASAKERFLTFKDVQLQIRGPVAPEQKQAIRGLFDEAKKAGRQYGMKSPEVDHFQMNFISRGEWRNILFERDHARAEKFSSTGLGAFVDTCARWLSRQWHVYTTPVSFEHTPAGRIYVVVNNFNKQSQADQHQLLAEAMIKAMQQANFPDFFRKHQDNRDHLPTEDPRPYNCSEAFAKMHVELCLDAMPKTDAALVARSWLPTWLMRSRPRQRPVMSPLQQDLKNEPRFGPWCAKLFATPVYVRVLFQNGGKVEIPAHTVSVDQELLRALSELNPGSAPEIVDVSAKSRV